MIPYHTPPITAMGIYFKLATWRVGTVPVIDGRAPSLTRLYSNLLTIDKLLKTFKIPYVEHSRLNSVCNKTPHERLDRIL